MVKARAKWAELRINRFGNLGWEPFQDIFVALQTGQASRLASLTAMASAVEIINDKVHLCQPRCHGRRLPLLQTHAFEMTGVIMDNGLQAWQSVSHLCSKVIPLGQTFCANDIKRVKDQARF